VGKGINKWKMENRKDQTRDECEREEKKNETEQKNLELVGPFSTP